MDKIKDEILDQVSGGAVQVGTTSYGYPVYDNGSVKFTDKTGESIVLSKSEWEKLKSNYAFTGGNPEAYLRQVSIKEMKEAKLIASNPIGV